MLSYVRPAAYKCIFPVYHSSLYSQSKESPHDLFFPAWPQIKNPHQPLCLPTLMRAVYFEHLGAFVEPEAVDEATEKYLSRPEILEPEINKKVIAFLKSQQIFSQNSAEMGKFPHVISNTFNTYTFKISPDSCNDYIHLLRDLGDSVGKSRKAFMQASIYGNFENLIGSRGAFAYAHELAHYCAGSTYGGVVLDELSKSVHKTLNTLATARLSRKQKTQLWEQFDQANKQIECIVQKFEPIEEIYANYIGMRSMPLEVRNTVEASLEQKLKANNWDRAYKSFIEACDNSQFFTPDAAAEFIFELVCRVHEQIDNNSVDIIYNLSEIAKVLFPYYQIKERENGINQDELDIFERKATEKINSILEQAGIPNEVFWSDSTWSPSTPIADIVNLRRRRIAEGINNDEAPTLLFDPIIMLLGRTSRNEIDLFINDSQQEYEDNLSFHIRIFYESLRQQLSEGCGIVCPFSYKGKPCCGLNKELWRLYKRLSKEDRKNFDEPDCRLAQ